LGNDQTPCNPSTSSYKCDNPSVMAPAGTFSGPVAAMAAYFSWHIRCHNGDDANPLILSQNACQELHQPADPSLGEYGYGWICTSRPWAGGLTCTHTGSNNLNYYVVWLGFGIGLGFVAFTNGGGRSGSADFAMVDQAVSTAINGPSKCESRIPSSYYASKEPTIAPSVKPTDTFTSPPTLAPVQMCLGKDEACSLPSDCCGNRCSLNKCKSYKPTIGKKALKLSGGHGGAAGAAGNGPRTRQLRGL
jgi:hypothetical protein